MPAPESAAVCSKRCTFSCAHCSRCTTNKGGRRQLLELPLEQLERCQTITLESSPLVGTAVYQAVLDFLATWDENHGIIFAGDVGTGKTGLLVGLLKRLVHHAVERQWQARFITAPLLFVKLKQGFSDGSYLETLHTYSKAHLLELDDLRQNGRPSGPASSSSCCSMPATGRGCRCLPRRIAHRRN